MFWHLFLLGFAVAYLWAVSALYWLLTVYPEQTPDLPLWYRRWFFDPDFDARMEEYERRHQQTD